MYANGSMILLREYYGRSSAKQGPQKLCSICSLVEVTVLTGTGEHSESCLFIAWDVVVVDCSIVFKPQVILFIGPGSQGLRGRVSFYHNAERMFYVSDPCEHLDQGDDGDVGFFRGVFKSFMVSKVRRMLIDRGAQLHPTAVCPYCKAKLWNMLQANMVPLSASCKLGAYEDSIEYYVCLNGHMLGICTLLPLSDSEEASESE